MKVSNTGLGKGIADIQKSNTKAGDAKELSAKVNEAKLSGASQVNVSDKARAFNKAKAIASDNSIDQAKVDRLQKLIDSGEYKTDASAIADRLVDEHMSMTD